MVLQLNHHSSWEAVYLPMMSYSQLLSEESHVQPIWCPLIVSEAGYVDGSGFAGPWNYCACPFLFELVPFC